MDTQSDFWKKKIIEWGISLDAIDYFGLRPTPQNNIIYPSNPGERYRILITQSGARSKNVWDNKTRHLPASALFHLAALEQSSVIYVANGEKSTMAMWSAGIRNVVNTFGEGNRIPEAILLLKNHHVIVIPDCDQHGLNAAYRWHTKVQQSNTPLNIKFLDMSLYLEVKYGMGPKDYYKWDTRDLWLLLNQDKSAFYDALQALPELDFERYADKLKTLHPPSSTSYSRNKLENDTAKKKPVRSTEIDFVEAYDNWWFGIVLPALEIAAPPLPRGKHRHCPNPHHADKHPSFRIDEKGMVFCTCGIQHAKKPREIVAEWIGAKSWEDYKKELIAEHNQNLRNYVTETDDHCYFPYGIPDKLRESFLRIHSFDGKYHDHAAAALVYELWHMGIYDNLYTPQNSITVQGTVDLAATLGFETTAKTVRRGIRQLRGLGFIERIKNLPNPSGKGRSVQQFKLRPLKVALIEFCEKLCFRWREKLFNDQIPDTVEIVWFLRDKPEIAKALTKYENLHREGIYCIFEDRRAKVEESLAEAAIVLQENYEVKQLLTKHSSTLTMINGLANGRDYRDVYYRAMAVDRAQKSINITAQQAAEQLGVTTNTMRDIRSRTGIVIEPQYKTFAIRKAEKVLEQLDNAAPWAKERLFGRKIVSSSGRVIHPVPPYRADLVKLMDEMAALELQNGHELTGKIQVASRERLATDAEYKATQRRLQEQIEKRKARAEYNKIKARQTSYLPDLKNDLKVKSYTNQDTQISSENEATDDMAKRRRLKRIKRTSRREAFPLVGFSPEYIEAQLRMSDSTRDEEVVRAIRAKDYDTLRRKGYEELIPILMGTDTDNEEESNLGNNTDNPSEKADSTAGD